ncbi:MAG: hypothetical protein KDK36_17710 [Leptospiraceae bacterium]|nr:hypothetical protein [Leptospiraceae bacterium]
MQDNKVPNPNGRKGGEKHQNKVKEVVVQVEKKGLLASLEHFLKLVTGKRKFIDVAGLDSEGNEIEYHQVGKETKKGLPVKRERDTIEEISNSKDVEIYFHPYNKE